MTAPDVAGRGPARRTVRRVLAVLIGTAVLVGLAVVLARYVENELLSCSPPGKRAQAAQETFVRAHVADASDLHWYLADCDDNGTGFLRFHSALAPAAAQEAFLSGGACAAADGAPPAAYSLECTSHGAAVSILLDDAEAGGTDAELALP